MKKLIFGISFLFLHAPNVKSQCNLVPNSGFEINTNCVSGSGGILLGYAPPWTSPNNGTTYLFNSCYPINTGTNVPYAGYGYQQANSGNGYCAIVTFSSSVPNLRQYVQVELDSTLIMNTVYCVDFYVNLSNFTGIGTNNIGIYFSDSATNIINNEKFLNFIPQINITNTIIDSLNWTQVSGTYVAQGGERYIIIGNFYPDSLTDTVAIPSPFSWDTHSGHYNLDDVDVHRCTCNVGIDELKNETSFNLIPNPNNGTMQLNYSLENNETGMLKLYDIVGKEISEYRLVQGNTTLNINEEKLNNGLYIYKVIVNDKVVKSDRLVIVK